MSLSPIASAFMTFVAVISAAPMRIGSRRNTNVEEFPFHEAASRDESKKNVTFSCNLTCDGILQNAVCNEQLKVCECDEEFPVQLPIGCAKPLLLGEQCLYNESCLLNDPFSACLQINHNAYCSCIVGYHEVSLQKQSKKNFCSKDTLEFDNNTRTLILSVAGVALFSTLICFVLKLLAGKSSTRRNLVVSTRLLSAAEIAQMARSFQRSNQDVNYSRRGSYGVAVPSSRIAAARAAAILLVSCNIPAQESPRQSSDLRTVSRNTTTRSSNSSSSRSFSGQKFKRENDMKLARSQQLYQQQLSASSFETATFTE